MALLLWAALLLAPPAAAQPVTLRDGDEVLLVDGVATRWLDERGTATLDDVLRTPHRFGHGDAGQIAPLAPGNALWLRLRLQRAADAHQQWLLAWGDPLIDRLEVWQMEGRSWRMQVAGDTIAVDQWPERGRYPVFRLALPAGEARDVYIRVRSQTPTSLPLHLSTDGEHAQRVQLETLGLGAIFGALLLLVAACIAQSIAYRDRAYGWYAAYAGITTLCLVAYTGVAAHLLWPTGGPWPDLASGTLAFLGMGAAILFVRRLLGVAARHPVLDRATYLGGWLGLPLAVAYLLVPRAPGLQVLSAYFAAGLAMNVTAAWLACRRGDIVGRWVLAAFVPLALAITLFCIRMLGWLPINFFTQYASLLAVVAEVPLLLVALSIRSRDRHGAQIRAQALSSQDALTGLLSPHLFQDRLLQVVMRARRDKAEAAIVFVDLVNHARIRQVHGQAVADQSLLRSVLKLRRVVRDVDTVGRVGEARFGLILEGVSARSAVTHRAARLIASGLMPLPGLKPEVTLHFHIAAVLLNERAVEPATVADDLGALLASMSPRTRRPIRFLDADNTQPVPLDTDSELPSELSVRQA
ncbi:sensor domain-containing diguanylate cyclase [Ramlibacter algicola]|uniref:Diguanylate cyclase n=1 Tax=Ramlibacter algicola TaxID=2795217 RepID=A0A934PZ18_9BURK|nr:7TM diverse intracellular signaling domain-containing protein [Ramlibacter algicola]MBK0391726.1 diguanylate cyclase [Ramlibacter algicola]